MYKPLPLRLAPPLRVPCVHGGTWDIRDRNPTNFTMIVFYRHGLCSLCKSYLQELEKFFDGFRSLGVEPIAISTDRRISANSTYLDWGLKQVPIGYELSLSAAAAWGLYLSNGRRKTEPDVFSEPGLFLVSNDRRIYFASTQSMPFARPLLADMLDWTRKVIEKKIPPRGALGSPAVSEGMNVS